jgi:hypothetical protein
MRIFAMRPSGNGLTIGVREGNLGGHACSEARTALGSW